MQNGLENIGKHLAGEANFCNLYPIWRELEERTLTPVDFDPSAEQDIPDTASCADVDPSETETPEEEEGGEEKNETLENFFHLLPYWCFINRAFGGVPVPGLNTSVSEHADIGEDLTSGSNVDALDVNQRLNSLIFLETIRQQYAQQVPQGGLQNSFNHVQNSPFISPDIFEANKISKHPSYLSTDSKYHEALHSGLRGLSSTDQEEERDNDEPLDLTQKNKGAENRKYGSREVSTRSLNNTTTDSKPTKVSPRPTQPRASKGYTTTELELALRDIQSGKLGTRRAAVIYGIPRSTLRNKVYKLGKDRSRPYFRQKNAATNFGEDLKEDPASSNTDSRIIKDQSSSARNHAGNMDTRGGGETGIESTANNVLPHTTSLLSSIPSSHSQGGVLSSSFPSGGGADSEEEEIGTIIKSEEDISHEKKVLKEWLRTKLSRQAFQQHLNSPINERFNSSGSRNLNQIEPNSDSSDNSDEMSRQDLRKEVILKIPSLLNNKSSLSRVISRKKLKRRSPRDEEEDEGNNSSSYSIPLLNMLGLEASTSSTNATGGEGKSESVRAWKNPRLTNNNNNENDSMEDETDSPRSLLSHGGNKQGKNNSSWGDYNDKDVPTASNHMGPMTVDANGKKSRPKRGKYRNYDREALLKAVRAVQNGEMSVHRAGSFYGVPHSTLEYKVKERHLLRRPKRKETESPKLSKSSPESSMSGSDLRSSEPQISRNLGGGAETTTNSLPLTPDLRESLSRYMNIGSSTSSFKNPDNDNPARGENNRFDNLNSSSLGLGRGVSPFLNLNLFNLDELLIRQNLGSVGNNNSGQNSLLDLTKK